MANSSDESERRLRGIKAVFAIIFAIISSAAIIGVMLLFWRVGFFDIWFKLLLELLCLLFLVSVFALLASYIRHL